MSIENVCFLLTWGVLYDVIFALNPYFKKCNQFRTLQTPVACKEKIFNSERVAIKTCLVDDVIFYLFNFLFEYKIYPFEILATP